jgi:hypothetical protein
MLLTAAVAPTASKTCPKPEPGGPAHAYTMRQDHLFATYLFVLVAAYNIPKLRRRLTIAEGQVNLIQHSDHNKATRHPSCM